MADRKSIQRWAYADEPGLHLWQDIDPMSWIIIFSFHLNYDALPTRSKLKDWWYSIELFPFMVCGKQAAIIHQRLSFQVASKWIHRVELTSSAEPNHDKSPVGRGVKA